MPKDSRAPRSSRVINLWWLTKSKQRNDNITNNLCVFSRPLLFHISWLYYCIKSSPSINNQSTENDNDFNTNLPRFMHQDKYESYYKARSPRCSWKFAIICANHYRPVGSSQTFNRIPLISYKQRNLYWRYYNIKSILGMNPKTVINFR